MRPHAGHRQSGVDQCLLGGVRSGGRPEAARCPGRGRGASRSKAARREARNVPDEAPLRQPGLRQLGRGVWPHRNPQGSRDSYRQRNAEERLRVRRVRSCPLSLSRRRRGGVPQRRCYVARFAVNSWGSPSPPSRVLVNLIASPETVPLYRNFIVFPLNSKVCVKEIVSPSILPSAIGMSPWRPLTVPVSVLPSALKVNVASRACPPRPGTCAVHLPLTRSEERRVGKECRSRW